MNLERRIIHSGGPKKPIVLQERTGALLQLITLSKSLHIRYDDRDRKHPFYDKFPADQPLIITSLNVQLNTINWVQVMDNVVCEHSPIWKLEALRSSGKLILRLSDGREYLLPRKEGLYLSGYTMLFNMLERVDVSQDQLNAGMHRLSTLFEFLKGCVISREKWWDAADQIVRPRPIPARR